MQEGEGETWGSLAWMEQEGAGSSIHSPQDTSVWVLFPGTMVNATPRLFKDTQCEPSLNLQQTLLCRQQSGTTMRELPQGQMVPQGLACLGSLRVVISHNHLRGVMKPVWH